MTDTDQKKRPTPQEIAEIDRQFAEALAEAQREARKYRCTRK